jgi:hypothetical protein
MLIYFFKWEEIYFQKVQGIASNGNSAVVQTLNTE